MLQSKLAQSLEDIRVDSQHADRPTLCAACFVSVALVCISLGMQRQVTDGVVVCSFAIQEERESIVNGTTASICFQSTMCTCGHLADLACPMQFASTIVAKDAHVYHTMPGMCLTYMLLYMHSN